MAGGDGGGVLVPCEMRVLRLALESICCSTWLYITSCWVKVIGSIGLVGSWFFSCVVSRVRKVEKFPDSCFIESGAVEVAGAEEAGVTVMVVILKP